MLKKTLAALVLAGSLLACSRAPDVIVQAPSADVDKPGSFVVQGSATLEVAPDCADITMTITADGAKPGGATKAAQDKEQQLIAALLALGLEKPDLKRSHLALEPIYEQTRDGWSPTKIATYRATITITASTKKFDLVAPVMEAGSSAGASAMSTQFRRSDLTELKRRARAGVRAGPGQGGADREAARRRPRPHRRDQRDAEPPVRGALPRADGRRRAGHERGRDHPRRRIAAADVRGVAVVRASAQGVARLLPGLACPCSSQVSQQHAA